MAPVDMTRAVHRQNAKRPVGIRKGRTVGYAVCGRWRYILRPYTTTLYSSEGKSTKTVDGSPFLADTWEHVTCRSCLRIESDRVLRSG